MIVLVFIFCLVPVLSLKSSLIRVSCHLVWSFWSTSRSIRLGLSDMKFSLKWCLRQASLHSSCFRSRFWVISSGVLRLVWGDKMLPGTLTGSVMFGSFCSKGRTRFVLFLFFFPPLGLCMKNVMLMPVCTCVCVCGFGPNRQKISTF